MTPGDSEEQSSVAGFVPPATPEAEEWSSPAVYGRGLVTIEPMDFTGVDPFPPILLPEWQQLTDADAAAAEAAQGGENAWGHTTYGGRRKHRPQPEAPGRSAQPGVERGLAADLLDAGDAPPAAAPSPASSPATATATTTGSDAGAESNRKVLASSRTMAIASLVSRVTGLLRSLLLVFALGLTPVADAYNSANTFPNMVYELLLGGVLSSVLIPLIVHAQESDDDQGVGYTQRLLSIATVVLGVTTLLAVVAAPLIAAIYVDAGPKRELTSILGTLLLPEIFFYGIGALVVAVLNTRRVYGPGAWAPVLNNVIVIATIGIYLVMPGPKSPTLGTITTGQILVLGTGTTLGIVAQSVMLLPSLRRSGFRWLWRFRALEHEKGRLGEVGSLAGWVIGYVVASQIGLSVILRVANQSDGGVASFTNADLLFQMPYGIIGVSLLTALMPRMSRAAARNDKAGVIADLSLGARLSSVGLIPITAGLIVLGPTLGSILFSHGASAHPERARHVGVALAIAAFGLVPFAIVMLQLRVYYSMRDARTPTLINVFMVVSKVVLVLVAQAAIPAAHVVEALNVATSISYLVGAIVGHVLLTRTLGPLGFGPVGRTVAQISAASAGGAVIAYGVLRLVEAGVGVGFVGQTLAFVLAGAIGLAAMGFLALRLRIPEIQDLRAAVGR